jgi:enamine deaminase RidA (YjgF/YER057c/UK114 family)
MPRQELLSPAQRAHILALPTDPVQLAECYSLSQSDLDLIGNHRGAENRLGFAVQLSLLKHPGRGWIPGEAIPDPLLRFIAAQVGTTPEQLGDYAQRDQTRREHLSELLEAYAWRTFGIHEYRALSTWLKDVARTTDQGMALIRALMAELRQRRILMPVVAVLDRLASAVRLRARREAYEALSKDGSNASKVPKLS